ncbi:class I SAM-dependent methyltransferase [Aliihoeflea sp. 2WW]|uniref:class I SAM-dependent methyltransferase n=1 Tax=Aliihoeflea sp. 2WW TaxID=1381123 RepID=UPI000464DAC1|nr:class I SAM-dependent methyltransferase [Aliihoeflea sp. 2WW]
MRNDIVDLRAFYATMLGKLAERSIAMGISSVWANLSRERLVGLGYALPWLERFGTDADRVFAFMPAQQGSVPWPAGKPCTTALVFEEELPLHDSSVDRILLVHALEHAENPREMLVEMWRVLAPGGRLVLVVPNRRGVWARMEHTPFGTGRPFSKGQLSSLLRDANFTPGPWSDALHFPPMERRFMMRLYSLLERTGRRFWPVFAGVLVVEAQKRVYQGLPVTQRASRRVFVPVLSPQGAGAARLRRDKGRDISEF